ncbi:MAG: hypothetical protein K0Q56_905 [Sporolactobacillus laevolacticus]|jgi:hypothetical protein|nr:hypothetical protein [Sporolactobacillus laevolacticus]
MDPLLVLNVAIGVTVYKFLYHMVSLVILLIKEQLKH